MTTWTADQIEAGRKLFAGNVAFELGVVAMSGLPVDDRAEVAFAGRSNVGKSSLINALTNRKGLARASAEPGRTREVNYFDLADGTAWLVDLPGYGYAKVSRTQSDAWMKLTRKYLRGRASLRRVFLLIDARRGLMPPDLDVMDMLDTTAVVYQIVLTKTDKLKSGEIESMHKKTLDAMAKRPAAYPEIAISSAVKGFGLPELRAKIASLTG